MQYNTFSMKVLTDCTGMALLNEMMPVDLVHGACIIINADLRGEGMHSLSTTLMVQATIFVEEARPRVILVG